MGREGVMLKRTTMSPGNATIECILVEMNEEENLCLEAPIYVQQSRVTDWLISFQYFKSALSGINCASKGSSQTTHP